MANSGVQAADSGNLVDRWLAGKVTLAELRGYSEDELVAIAEIGFGYFAQGKYDSANTVFEGLAAIQPRIVYHRKALGAIANARSKFSAALQHFDAAVQLDANDAEAWLGHGEAQLGLKRPREAELDFVRAKRCGQESALGLRADAFLRALKSSPIRR